MTREIYLYKIDVTGGWLYSGPVSTTGKWAIESRDGLPTLYIECYWNSRKPIYKTKRILWWSWESEVGYELCRRTPEMVSEHELEIVENTVNYCGE